MSITSVGSYSHTPVELPPFRNGFPLRGHSQMPHSQDSQSPSLCFPHLPCSFIFSSGINSFPFPLVHYKFPVTSQGMDSRGWRLNCGWSLSQALCAASGVIEQRAEGKERKSNDLEFTSDHYPREKREMQTGRLLLRNTPIKFVMVETLPKCLKIWIGERGPEGGYH